MARMEARAGGARPRPPVWLAPLLAAAAACGSAPLRPAGSGTSTTAGTTSTIPPSTSTTVPATSQCGVVPSPDGVVTSATEPCALTTHVGATVHVSLPAGYTWNDPTSSSPAVQVTAIERPAAGILEADLRALATGRATITSSGEIACARGQPCPQLARLWSLRVSVVASAGAPRTVTVSEQDSGKSVTLRRGDGLYVTLFGPAIYVWTQPVSSDTTVLEPLWGSSGSPASAGFLAAGHGTASVSATGNPSCYPQCLAPSRLFRVVVTVTG